MSCHYIANCKNLNNGNWYNFNDAIVRLSDTFKLESGKPDILFYERIN